MSQLMVFLDDGGVMNDNSRRAPHWQRLIGEFFVPLLGGTSEAWAEANRIVAECLFDPENWRMRIQAASDYTSFDYTYQLDWLGGMCKLLDIPTPPAEESIELAHCATAYIVPRVHAAYSSVADAIRTLHSQS